LSVREVAEIVNCSTTTAMKIKKIFDKQIKVDENRLKKV